jgi:hypothetical protein
LAIKGFVAVNGGVLAGNEGNRQLYAESSRAEPRVGKEPSMITIRFVEEAMTFKLLIS